MQLVRCRVGECYRAVGKLGRGTDCRPTALLSDGWLRTRAGLAKIRQAHRQWARAQRRVDFADISPYNKHSTTKGDRYDHI